MNTTFETPPSASLNRVQIMDLPGLQLDESVRGRRGDELISNRALMALAAPYADALGLDAADLPAVTYRLTHSKASARHDTALVVNRALELDEGEAATAAAPLLTVWDATWAGC